MVLAGAFGMILSNLHAGAIGALMQPLEVQFGWSRAQISASIMIICICQLMLGPFAGALVDRVGPRRVALVGVILFAIALAAVGLSGPSITSWYVAWAAVGITYPAVSTVVWTMGISRCFERHRGLAFAVALSGVGVANFTTPLIAIAALPVFGWRGTFLALALGGLAVTFPLVWLLFHPGRIAKEATLNEAGAALALPGFTARKILHSIRFWALALAMLLVSAAIGALALHFQPIMRDAGLSASQAAGYAALTGPALIVGRIFGGYLLDRLPTRYVAAVCFTLPAAVCAILLNYDASPTMSALAAVFLGVSFGVEGDVVAYMTARYFGLKRYGFAYAILYGLYAFGFGVAPVIAGGAFDALGSYDAVLKLLIVGLLLSGVVAALIGRPPEFEAPGSAESGAAPFPAAARVQSR